MPEKENKSLNKAIAAFRATRQRRSGSATSAPAVAATTSTAKVASGKGDIRQRLTSADAGSTSKGAEMDNRNDPPANIPTPELTTSVVEAALDSSAAAAYLPDDVTNRLSNLYKQAEWVTGANAQPSGSPDHTVVDSDAVQQALKSIEMADTAFDNYSRAMTEVAGVSVTMPSPAQADQSMAPSYASRSNFSHRNPQGYTPSMTQGYNPISSFSHSGEYYLVQYCIHTCAAQFQFFCDTYIFSVMLASTQRTPGQQWRLQ